MIRLSDTDLPRPRHDTHAGFDGLRPLLHKRGNAGGTGPLSCRVTP